MRRQASLVGIAIAPLPAKHLEHGARFAAIKGLTAMNYWA